MTRYTRIGTATATLALSVVLAGCASSDGPASTADESADGAQVSVAISDFAYEPESIKVSAGDTVRWTNQDMFAHTVTATQPQGDSSRFDAALGDLGEVDAEGTTFQRTFDEPGTYTYFCRFHPDMKGTVVVTDG